jgi:uncharacterized protein (DUF488 family)
VAVIIYFTNHQGSIEKVDDLKSIMKQTGISYSWYMAVGGMVASFANLVVGSFVVCLADKFL